MYQFQPVKSQFSPQAPQAPKPQVNPYEQFRQRAQQQNQAQMQQQQNALQRRFAQLGGGPSGAQIKMEQDMQRQGAEDLSSQIGSINAQEAQAQQQANQFQQQFGLEQTKALSGIDMARRQQALDEMGQNYNMIQAMAASPMSFDRQYNEINRAGNFLNQQAGAGGLTPEYYSQLQALANPMLRRLQMAEQSAQGGQV